MATAIAPLSDKQLEAEISAQQGELRHLRERLASEQKKLDGAVAERSRVVDAIERGETGKQSDLSRAKEAVEEIEIRIGGLRKNVAPIEAKIAELTAESQRRQVAAAKVARENAFRDRTAKLRARGLKIREALALLCTGELFAFEQERAALALEFGDIGGLEAAKASLEILFKPAHPSEALRNPEVHLAALDKAGMVSFGFEIVAESVRSVVHGEPDIRTVRLRPGPPFRFTILPMRPRAS